VDLQGVPSGPLEGSVRRFSSDVFCSPSCRVLFKVAPAVLRKSSLSQKEVK
jgi:hypothetical protein